jgi:hypothetical protein
MFSFGGGGGGLRRSEAEVRQRRRRSEARQRRSVLVPHPQRRRLVRRRAVDLLERIGPRSVDLLEQWAVDLLLERPSTMTPLDDDPPSMMIVPPPRSPAPGLHPSPLSPLYPFSVKITSKLTKLC